MRRLKPDAVPTIFKRKLHEAAGTGEPVSKNIRSTSALEKRERHQVTVKVELFYIHNYI